MIIKVVGAALIVFGLIDLVGSFAGLDVWTDWLKVSLPEIVWRFTAYIELALGYFLFGLGSPDLGDAEELD